MNKLWIATLASVAMVGSAYAAPQANTPAPQASPAQASQAAPQANAAKMSDAELKKFADVHQDVVDVSSKYQAELQATNNPDAAAEIAQKANREMAEIVEKSPLSLEEYNQYAMLLQNDQQFQKKYLEMTR